MIICAPSLRLDDEVEHRLDGVAAAVGDRLALDDDRCRPERAEQVLPARQSVGDVARDSCPRRRLDEPLERRRRAALLRPRGQQAREQRAAGAVRVLVEAHVDDVGGLQQLEQRLDQRLVGERLQVGDVQGST